MMGQRLFLVQMKLGLLLSSTDATFYWQKRAGILDKRHLFRCFAVFVDGCTWGAADEICTATGQWQGDVLEGLISLVDKSLLR
jgi:hypothetical protein